MPGIVGRGPCHVRWLPGHSSRARDARWGRLPQARRGTAPRQRDGFPAVAGDDGAVGTEPVAEGFELPWTRRWVEAPGEAVTLAHAEIVDGPDVEPAELEHQVHLRRPTS